MTSSLPRSGLADALLEPPPPLETMAQSKSLPPRRSHDKGRRRVVNNSHLKFLDKDMSKCDRAPTHIASTVKAPALTPVPRVLGLWDLVTKVVQQSLWGRDTRKQLSRHIEGGAPRNVDWEWLGNEAIFSC